MKETKYVENYLKELNDLYEINKENVLMNDYIRKDFAVINDNISNLTDLESFKEIYKYIKNKSKKTNITKYKRYISFGMFELFSDYNKKNLTDEEKYLLISAFTDTVEADFSEWIPQFVDKKVLSDILKNNPGDFEQARIALTQLYDKIFPLTEEDQKLLDSKKDETMVK